MNFLNPFGKKAPLGLRYSLPMNILLAGGTGYIGGRLSEYLVEIGHSVTVLTRKHKGSFLEIEQVRYLQVEWSSIAEDSNFCDGVDIVVNAAGMTSRESQNSPSTAEGFSKNVTKKLIDKTFYTTFDNSCLWDKFNWCNRRKKQNT